MMTTQQKYDGFCEILRLALNARSWPPVGIVLRADWYNFMATAMRDCGRMGTPELFDGIPVHKGDGMQEEFIFLTT